MSTTDVTRLQHPLSAHVTAHLFDPSFYFLPGVGGVFQAHAAAFCEALKNPSRKGFLDWPFGGIIGNYPDKGRFC